MIAVGRQSAGSSFTRTLAPPRPVLLTRARRALVEALREWPDLSVVNTWIIADRLVEDAPASEPAMAPTGLDELPCVRVVPARSGVQRRAHTNVSDTAVYAMEVTGWTAGWDVADAERLLYLLTVAALAGPNRGQLPAVQRETGRKASVYGPPATVEAVRLASREPNRIAGEGVAATRVTLTVLLPLVTPACGRAA